ncbi:nucleotide exchange factor GrpE [Pseudoroseomonas wenyumeiae]|uniref:Protein GrpE n=1 Tax=Teichococcus wenyumeiae TaxID=2478470 RepID=A0A3A9JRI5_9PROT|nr:nucleotide exchange factor GrpE [Pseudoroseomonas wenyumeiae]RMI25328.1 nucleotide exchange factor GrpE [Pseudoroseomonas wenyumeiae]
MKNERPMNEQTNTPPPAAETEQNQQQQPQQPADAMARIAELEAELTQMKDRWLRSEAEMQNLRARTKREVDDARQYAVQKFARDVVEAAENLRRGLDALPPAKDDEPELLAKLRGGFEGVERNFVSILERNGVVKQDPAGQPFDPELHQAMAQQPPPAGVAAGTVIQAWTPAWTLNGRLLKPAMVVVAGEGVSETA